MTSEYAQESSALESHEDALAAKKALARKDASARRKAFHAENGENASNLVAENALTALAPKAGQVVSAFLPIGSEVDLSGLMAVLEERGCAVALPCVIAPETPLVFRRWKQGDALVKEDFGTRAPSPDAEAMDPDILFVPMLAFDQAGYRLGYGGGFYDRSLDALRRHKPVLAVGTAYSAQEVEAVPRGIYDQPLDWIVTEREAIRP